MGFYFEWKKVLDSKKNPMIFTLRQVSKDFTCSKKKKYIYIYIYIFLKKFQRGKTILKIFLLFENNVFWFGNKRTNTFLKAVSNVVKYYFWRKHFFFLNPFRIFKKNEKTLCFESFFFFFFFSFFFKKKKVFWNKGIFWNKVLK